VLESLSNKGLKKEYITLHVGAGTFKPIKSATIREHQMHSEPFSVTLETLEALAASENIIAVGTTSLRTLESLFWLGIKLENGFKDLSLTQWEPYSLDDKGYSYKQSLAIIINHAKRKGLKELQCRTSLMIIPGYHFKSAQALVTNFHQPRSTLLLLIAAFIGEDWKKVYQHALDNDYRFLSYGDSSLLWRRTNV
jgi:S-adenosylmethionine:tRNA ribosyltransferase-isomerase